MRNSLALLVVLLLGAQTRALAQVAGSPGESSSAPWFCMRPASSCRTSIITEVSLSSAGFGRQSAPGHFQWDLGFLAGVHARHAVGASLSFGEPDHGHLGGNVRYRFWLNEPAAVEVAPGVARIGPRGEGEGTQVALTLDVALAMDGWIALFVHGASGPGQGRVGAGARLAAWPGLIVGVVAHAFIGLIGAMGGVNTDSRSALVACMRCSAPESASFPRVG